MGILDALLTSQRKAGKQQKPDQKKRTQAVLMNGNRINQNPVAPN